jgi:hypothetical protein
MPSITRSAVATTAWELLLPRSGIVLKGFDDVYSMVVVACGLLFVFCRWIGGQHPSQSDDYLNEPAVLWNPGSSKQHQQTYSAST